jgi:hypothetical protein
VRQISLDGGGEQKTEPRKIKEKITECTKRRQETECTGAKRNGCQREVTVCYYGNRCGKR